MRGLKPCQIAASGDGLQSCKAVAIASVRSNAQRSGKPYFDNGIHQSGEPRCTFTVRDDGCNLRDMLELGTVDIDGFRLLLLDGCPLSACLCEFAFADRTVGYIYRLWKIANIERF